MPTLEQCTRRCFTLFFENYGSCGHLNCPECLAAETRAKRGRAGEPGGHRRDRVRRPADVPAKPKAA